MEPIWVSLFAINVLGSLWVLFIASQHPSALLRRALVLPAASALVAFLLGGGAGLCASVLVGHGITSSLARGVGFCMLVGWQVGIWIFSLTADHYKRVR